MSQKSSMLQRSICLLLCLAAFAAACSGSDSAEIDDPPSTPGGSASPVSFQQLGGSLTTASLRLSEGSSYTPSISAVPLVEGTALSEDETADVLARLGDWVVPDEDLQDFNRPTESLRPPLVGDTIESAFPPPGAIDAAPTPIDGPLHVLRVQPDGEVDVAPFLSVTFDQPMVALATVDQLDGADVPVTISPALEGRWRWIGTRTLRFEVNPSNTDRLPAATEYVVEIPAGTTSASGGVLAQAAKFRFATPAPHVESFVGESESLALTAVFVATFDQIVAPAAILDAVTLTADGETRDVRLATTEEIEADRDAARAVEAGLEGRVVAFVATEPLPPDSDVVVSFDEALPSAEGPRVTTEPQSFAGRTFSQLKVSTTRCGYGDGCRPFSPFTFEFNNPIDAAVFEPSMVTADPNIPGMRVNVFGNVVEVTGSTAGRTTYKVRLDATMTDIFGQTLGEAVFKDFEVGAAQPLLQGFDRPFVTVDPTASRPTVSATSINHDSVRVTAWAVEPSDYPAFQRYLETTYSDAEPATPPWTEVFDDEISIDADDDTVAVTTIDLTDAFAESGGPIVARIEPTREFSPTSDEYWQNRPTFAFVQQTTLGIDAFLDGDEVLIWTTDLGSGEPLSGVEVELLGPDTTVTTDADGLARASLSRRGVFGLVGRLGDRVGMLPSGWYDGWTTQQAFDEVRWFLFDDRGIYKPGETARITGWVRAVDPQADTLLKILPASVKANYRVYDPQGNDIANGSTEINALGGFNLSVAIPENANLGQANIEFELTGSGSPQSSYANHQLQIQEFRTPEFEVNAHAETPGPYFTADPATVGVDAAYYAGGALPDAEVNWLVSTSSATYAPPGWDDFVFGKWQPWWFDNGFGGDVAVERAYADSEDCFDCGPSFGDTAYEHYAGRTDDGGSHYLQIDFGAPSPDLPSTVTAEATVFDVNRQAWASRTDLLVHAARFYAGLRTDRPFVEKGTPIRVDIVVTDVDGVAAAGREVEVTAARVESTYENGTWTEQLVDPSTCTATSTDMADPGEIARCEFPTEIGGTYRITALITDEDGHQNRTEITQWVTGGEHRPSRGVQQDNVTIVPDAMSYVDGDTAELFVQAPFAPASGLLTIARGAIESTISFDAPDGTAIVEVPIDDSYVPNVTVQIDMVGSAERTADDGTSLPEAPRRTAFASGRIDLSVPPVRRTLAVVATPADPALHPGDDTSLTVEVRDADGDAVQGAGVAIVVVDEAVLALTGYELRDPLESFYGAIWSNVFAEYVRSSVVLSDPELLAGGDGSRASGADGEAAADEDAAAGTYNAATPTTSTDSAEELEDGRALEGDDSATSPIEVRTDFGALAVYAPDETTGDDGTVTVAVPLPDNLTRYRVLAVAVDGADRFGKGEANITARLPLMVRPSAPRFLNFGDTFELPIVVQNQTDTAMEVDVAVQTANLTLTETSGKRVTVPGNDRIEVRFPAAADAVGTARFRVAVVSGTEADSAAVELPVYTPATAEAFATYGVIDAGAIAQPIDAPEGVIAQFGGLEINTSSTAVQALTDAVLYLSDYRYESADAYASRIIAVAALRDVLEAFDASGLPNPAQLNSQLARDIDRLAALQNSDGGFPYWQRGQQSIPWESVQATHALVLAKAAGYSVPSETLRMALDHLAEIDQHIPSDYETEVRATLRAYALYVRDLGGDHDADEAEGLYRTDGGELQLDAVAWLWPVIDDADLRIEIERLFENRAVETAGAATFATSYGEGAYVIANSDRRSDGVILDALITQVPSSDLIPKVVAGLLGGQVRGRWKNVQENAYILLALNRYFETFESVTPDFVARAWLGDRYVAEATFTGRATDRALSTVPMAELIEAGDSTVVVSKAGSGRLYYRLGLRYAPADLMLEARDEGFVVERLYEAVDDPGDVSRDSDGTWRVKAGAKVRIRLTMVADAQRTHVALLDPLPAGFEPQNVSLAVTPTTPPELQDEELAGVTDIARTGSWCWCAQWFEHQNLRDDRAEAFTSYLHAGTFEYTYVARATTPGTFVVAPARAEEVYAPEVFGRSPSASVVVE